MTVRDTSVTPGHGRSAPYSVVIATRDRPDSLARCLSSVRDEVGPEVEVIVVDSAPQLAYATPVAARFGARYERVGRPGLSRARNRGARLAQGEVVVFLDDDVTVEAGCIAALVAEFADPRVVAAGGRIVLEGGDDDVRRRFEPRSASSCCATASFPGSFCCGSAPFLPGSACARGANARPSARR